jgi:hypothetical protein
MPSLKKFYRKVLILPINYVYMKTPENVLNRSSRVQLAGMHRLYRLYDIEY